MQRNRVNTDGFVVRRRSGSSDLSLPRPNTAAAQRSLPQKYLIDSSKASSKKPAEAPGVVRREAVDLNEVLSPEAHQEQMKNQTLTFDLSLDDAADKKTKKYRGKRPWNRKKIIKIVAIVLAVLILSVGGYFAYRFFTVGSQIFKGNPLTAIFSQGKDLKEDANGRSTVLLFGTSEDDPGHNGANLTDSMMIASINQKKKEVFLISIPRDLYIDYGQGCPAGFKAKINAFYPCLNDKNGEEAAQQGLREKVGEIFGLDIQYSVHVNYSVLRDAVNAVGGITVNIESTDPRGILDRNFDWDCPKGLFSCYNVKYPNGPAQLDGKHALYLARARGANGLTYGLEQANFNREEYQRKILIAIKDKAVSAGTLTNPVAINGLLDALGKNVRTNFDADEIKTIVKLGQDVKSENIRSLALNDPEGMLVTTGSVGDQSIVRPKKGLFDYTDIRAAVKAYATGDFVSIENAKVDVLNASEQAGVAQVKADALIKENIKVNIIGNAPAALDTAPVQIFDMTGGKKPATLQKLESVLGVKVTSGKPAGVTSQAEFVVVAGTSKPAAAQ